MKKGYLVVLISFLVLFLDQWSKIYIKLNHSFGPISKWGIIDIYFIENPGMAFGLEFFGDAGKIGLTVFRIIAVYFIIKVIMKLLKNKASTLMLIAYAFIFVGALGNIFDSVFYGALFSETMYHSPAVFMPEDGGYAPFLMGHVVDMIHFNVRYPMWVPSLGGSEIFPPIFNIADAAITAGVALLIIKQKTFFGPNGFTIMGDKQKVQETEEEVNTEEQEA